MTFLNRVRTFFLGLALLGGALVTVSVTPALADAGGAAGRNRGTPSVSCDDCVVELAGHPTTGRTGATLSVNIAIVGLGIVWLALMTRRIQQQSEAASLSSDDLAGAVPQPAAGGH